MQPNQNPDEHEPTNTEEPTRSEIFSKKIVIQPLNPTVIDQPTTQEQAPAAATQPAPITATQPTPATAPQHVYIPPEPQRSFFNTNKTAIISMLAGIVFLVTLSIAGVIVMSQYEGTNSSVAKVETIDKNKITEERQSSSRSAFDSVTRQGTAKDSKRKADINAIYTHLEAYYNENGRYPTLSELSSSSFRAAYMKGLDSSMLIDPDGSETITSTASETRYGYAAPKTASCPSGRISECNQYRLTAILSDGSSYIKENLN